MLKSLLRTSLMILALSGFAAGTAYAAPPVKTMHTAKGNILVDSHGMTLYTFDKDKGGKSVCNGNCAKAWPPLEASADATPSGDWSIITRDDGSKQWAYKGEPVYTFRKDKKPGEVTGDDFHNVWHVIKQ